MCLSAALCAPLGAQSAPQPQGANAISGVAVAPLALPKDYVIGVQDVLDVVFWSATSKDLSAEVLVRPDGNILCPFSTTYRPRG